MKFCKNLQRIVDISDPEWAPYWTNYKMLKKLIKSLPSLVPHEQHEALQVFSSSSSSDKKPAKSKHVKSQSTDSSVATAPLPRASSLLMSPASKSCSAAEPDELNKNPGEVAFFKLLHAEFKKATFFFERGLQEFKIREERVREGLRIMKQPNSIMVNEKWSLLAKSIFRLYKDLLLFETFAIMTYCSFSKILKKHDKVTGHSTRNAFMANIVNKANFTNYPQLLDMIARCEELYEEVSKHLYRDGQEELYEDERLFLSMITRLNEQVMNTAEEEGAPERREGRKSAMSIAPKNNNGTVIADPEEAQRVSALRSLVEDNETLKAIAKVTENAIGDEFRKRPNNNNLSERADAKKHCIEK